jgi:hypothetical protein
MCSSVDLPDPDGPITATSSPRATDSETPRSASTAVSPSDNIAHVLAHSVAGLVGHATESRRARRDSSVHVHGCEGILPNGASSGSTRGARPVAIARGLRAGTDATRSRRCEGDIAVGQHRRSPAGKEG